MRYNVLGYNQELACKFNLDLEELLILTQMSDFFVSGNADYKEVDNKIYYWQSYSKIISDLPILGIKSKRTVARRMDTLLEKGMIEKYTEPRGQGSRTYFRLTEKYHSLKYKSQKLIDDHQVVIQKNEVVEKLEDNLPYDEIMQYLNDKTNRNFRNVESNKRLIRARFNEGYKLEDFKYVVDVKYNEWKGTEYEKYLQPSTLFSNKFDGYVNQPLNPKPQYKTREPITKANRGGTFEHIKPD